MSKVKVIGGGATVFDISNDDAMERFYREHRDPRLDTVKKDATVPNVGDTVRVNDRGLEQVFGGRTRGLAHMKTLKMKITHVDATSITYPKPTFAGEVDNPEINAYLITHHCFDIVKVA